MNWHSFIRYDGVWPRSDLNAMQDGQLVLDSVSHWQLVKLLQNRRNVVASPHSCQESPMLENTALGLQ